MSEISILLVDDQGVLRAGLRSLIEGSEDLQVVCEAGDCRAASLWASDHHPDVALARCSGPALEFAWVEQLREACPDLNVLLVTAHAGREHFRRVLASGARGVVIARAGAEELIQAIRVVARGGVYLDSALADSVVAGLVRPARNGQARPRRGLSERESEVLQLIAAGFANKEIASRLRISTKTVETHKARSMAKLGLSSRAQVVRYAMMNGWLHDLCT